MNTKDAIKQAACTLFNARGLAAVTLRDVAQSLDRSYGNITYHFPGKEQLVEAIYADMIAALGQISATFASAPAPLERILQAPQQTFAISLQYLFLLRDYLELIHQFPTLAENIRQSNEARKVGLRTLFIHLRAQGLLRPELADADLDYLMELSGAMRTFFFLQIRQEDLVRQSLESEYVDYVNRLLFPYLSADGQAVYREALKK